VVYQIEVLLDELQDVDDFLLRHDLIFRRFLIYFFVHFHVVVHSLLLLYGVELSKNDAELEHSAEEVILGLFVVVYNDTS
jgi:hypothetical protein